MSSYRFIRSVGLKDTQRFSVSGRWLLPTYLQTLWPPKFDGRKQSYKAAKAVSGILQGNSKVAEPVPEVPQLSKQSRSRHTHVSKFLFSIDTEI